MSVLLFIPLLLLTIFLALSALIYLGRMCLEILNLTAAGNERVDVEGELFIDWVGKGIYFLYFLVIWGLPSYILSSKFRESSEIVRCFWLSLPFWIFFPVGLLSPAISSNLWIPFTPIVLIRFFRRIDQAFLFYLLTGPIIFFLIYFIFQVLKAVDSSSSATMLAPIWVLVTFIYFRLLGRFALVLSFAEEKNPSKKNTAKNSSRTDTLNSERKLEQSSIDQTKNEKNRDENKVEDQLIASMDGWDSVESPSKKSQGDWDQYAESDIEEDGFEVISSESVKKSKKRKNQSAESLPPSNSGWDIPEAKVQRLQPSQMPGLQSPLDGEITGYDVVFDDNPHRSMDNNSEKIGSSSESKPKHTILDEDVTPYTLAGSDSLDKNLEQKPIIPLEEVTPYSLQDQPIPRQSVPIIPSQYATNQKLNPVPTEFDPRSANERRRNKPASTSKNSDSENRINSDDSNSTSRGDLPSNNSGNRKSDSRVPKKKAPDSTVGRTRSIQNRNQEIPDPLSDPAPDQINDTDETKSPTEPVERYKRKTSEEYEANLIKVERVEEPKQMITANELRFLTSPSLIISWLILTIGLEAIIKLLSILSDLYPTNSGGLSTVG